MKSKRLFITAIGGDIACATLRCIRRRAEVDAIVGCDINEYVQGRDYVDDFMLAPPYRDEEKYISFIKQTCEEKNITHFWPMTEPEIILVDKHRRFFEEKRIALIINNKKIIEVASSKQNTAIFLHDNNINSPMSLLLSDYEKADSDIKDKIGFPCIIKPDKSCGSHGLRIVNSRSELSNLLANDADSYVIQQYVGSAEEEYTVGVFSDGVTISSIAFRRRLGFGGMSVRVETVIDPKIDEISEKVGRLLDLKGSINIQMRKEGDDYFIFEINPRISSTVGFRDLLGFSDAVWWLKVASGETVKCNTQIESGKVGIRILDEKIF